jgi:UDPglucose 6-dehydrogenase
MREAPSLVTIENLLKSGVHVKVYDPVAMTEAKKHIKGEVIFCKDMYEAAIDCDAIALITEWTEFRIPNYNVLKKLMKGYAFFDGRNIYDPAEMKENGFAYYGIGRKTD